MHFAKIKLAHLLKRYCSLCTFISLTKGKQYIPYTKITSQGRVPGFFPQVKKAQQLRVTELALMLLARSYKMKYVLVMFIASNNFSFKILSVSSLLPAFSHPFITISFFQIPYVLQFHIPCPESSSFIHVSSFSVPISSI